MLSRSALCSPHESATINRLGCRTGVGSALRLSYRLPDSGQFRAQRGAGLGQQAPLVRVEHPRGQLIEPASPFRPDLLRERPGCRAAAQPEADFRLA